MKIDSFLEKWYQEIELLTERKQVGIIYHFTGVNSLIGITSDFTNSDPQLRSNVEEPFLSPNRRKYTRFVSTTRKHDFEDFGNIRFTLDGSKLSQKYKIEPINYYIALVSRPFQEDDLEIEDETDLEIEQWYSGAENLTEGGGQESETEYEERIWMPNNQTSIPLNKYCLEVGILVSANLDLKGAPFLKKVKDYFNKLGIPVLITTKFKPYGRDKGRQLPDITGDLNFENGNFEKGFFQKVNLKKANFKNANLKGADFRNANLKGADFRNANLKGVNFTNANLESANLHSTDLQDVNLYYANLNRAKNLNKAKNLHKIMYNGVTIWPEGFNIEDYK